MSETATTLNVEVAPEIQSNGPLHAAVQSATSYFQEGLEHIDATSQTPSICPEIHWSLDELDEKGGLKIVYCERPPDGRTFQHTLKRVPVSQILDGVGRRSWMLRLLQSINSNRYEHVMTRWEQMIREREEAEANGQ